MENRYGFKLFDGGGYAFLRQFEERNGLIVAPHNQSFSSTEGALVCKFKDPGSAGTWLVIALLGETQCIETENHLYIGVQNSEGKFWDFTSSPSYSNYSQGDVVARTLRIHALNTSSIPIGGTKFKIMGHTFMMEADPDEQDGFKIFIDDTLVTSECYDQVMYAHALQAGNPIFPLDLLGAVSSAAIDPQVADLYEAITNIEEYLGTGFNSRFVSR